MKPSEKEFVAMVEDLQRSGPPPDCRPRCERCRFWDDGECLRVDEPDSGFWITGSVAGRQPDERTHLMTAPDFFCAAFKAKP